MINHESQNRAVVLATLWLLAVLWLLAMATSTLARTLPAAAGESTFGGIVLRNLDEYDAHWGANLGYCWRGRIDARLESGYHHTVTSSRRYGTNVIPLRASLVLRTIDRLDLSPSITAWHVLGYDDLIPFGFVGLDFIWDRRLVVGAELNLNQDLRFHYLDLRLGFYW